MTKAPSFQFYPADWLNDIKLQSCSLEAQGLLVNLMCLMHQSEPYGFLTINSSVPSNKEVARLLRLHHKTYHARLKELFLYGALCRDENGVIFCKRMVKDEKIRQLRREAGKLGGSPLFKQKVNQPIKQKTTPSSSSSSSSKRYTSDSTEYGLSKLLYSKILLNNPEYKEPNFQTWARHIDLMIRIDKRTPEAIKNIIEWMQNDDFWYDKVLSTDKLRKQFDQLTTQKARKTNGTGKQYDRKDKNWVDRETDAEIERNNELWRKSRAAKAAARNTT